MTAWSTLLKKIWKQLVGHVEQNTVINQRCGSGIVFVETLALIVWSKKEVRNRPLPMKLYNLIAKIVYS